MQAIKPIITPILMSWMGIERAVVWLNIKFAPHYDHFYMMGDHGPFCPIDYGHS